MIEVMQFIFGEMDVTTVTPFALLALYMFALLLECISSIFHSTLRIGGLN